MRRDPSDICAGSLVHKFEACQSLAIGDTVEGAATGPDHQAAARGAPRAGLEVRFFVMINTPPVNLPVDASLLGSAHDCGIAWCSGPSTPRAMPSATPGIPAEGRGDAGSPYCALVGPRPLPTRDAGKFAEPGLMRRFGMRPGSRVCGRSAGGARWASPAGSRWNLEYIDRWSLWLDLILARTVSALMTAHGGARFQRP